MSGKGQLELTAELLGWAVVLFALIYFGKDLVELVGRAGL